MIRLLFIPAALIGPLLGLIFWLPMGARAEMNRAPGKQPVLRLEHGSQSAGHWVLAFSPDGSLMAVNRADGLFFYDVATGERQKGSRGLPPLHYGNALGFSLGGEFFFETTDNKEAKFWDILPKPGSRAPASPEGIFELLAVCPIAPVVALSTQSEVRFWDWSRGVELRERRTSAGKRIIECLAYSPDGRFLAGGAENSKGEGVVCLWSAASGRLLCTLRQERDRNASILAFSPDGRLLAEAVYVNRIKSRAMTASEEAISERKVRGRERPDSVIRVWEVASGREVFHIVREGAWENSLAISPRGWLLAACCDIDEHDVDLWDARTGELIHRFTAPKQTRLVPYVVFSADGRFLVTSTKDGTLVWDVSAHHRPPPVGPELSQADLDRMWADLAGADVKAARRAIRALTAAPKQSLSLFSEHLKPVPSPDAKRRMALIADLDSGEYAVRERANAALEKSGRPVTPALHQALEKASSNELRRRLKELIEKTERWPIPPGDTLRNVRALEVLENIDSAEAWKIIRTMSGGAPGAIETEDAKATLQRLNARRPQAKP
jgi:WD40 repeat protein